LEFEHIFKLLADIFTIVCTKHITRSCLRNHFNWRLWTKKILWHLWTL